MWYKILFFLLLPCSLFSQRKEFKLHLLGGLVGSQVQGDNLGGFDKPGITAGLGISRPLNKKWKIGFDLTYIQKGSRKSADPENFDYDYYLMSLHYIEVPIHLRYIINKTSIITGPSVAFLLKSSEETQSGPATDQFPFNKLDFSWFIGAGQQFSKNWSVDLKLIESVIPFRKTPNYNTRLLGNLQGQLNTSLVLTLNYHIKTR